MDKQFFARNNYIALKEIISSTTGASFNNKEDERKLYDNMIQTFDSTDTNNFHDLNKKCIGLYTNRFERQIPVNNEREDKNIINPVQSTIQSSIQNNIIESNESEPIIEQDDPNDLFAKVKQERENNYNVLASNREYERPISSIQEELHESFQSGQDLNQFHDVNRNTSDFKSDNVMSDRMNLHDNLSNQELDNIIQNSIDKTDVLGSKKDFKKEDEHIFNTLNPYSLFQQSMKNNENIELIQREVLIVIDSRDRDLESYPHSSHYQVKFGGRPDTIEIPTRLDENGVVIHETATLYKGYQGANINLTLKNIKFIQLINVTVPYIPVYVNGNPPVLFSDRNQTSSNMGGDPRYPSLMSSFQPEFIGTNIFPAGGPNNPIDVYKPSNKINEATGIPIDILDEPYLLVFVDEIDTQKWYRSTNEAAGSAFCRVMNPSIISSHTNASFAVFSPQSGEEKMKYDPTLLASIDKMTLHVKDQNNTHIDIGQDKIHIAEIKVSEGYIVNNCFSNTLGGKESFYQSVLGTDIVISQVNDDYFRDGCRNNTIKNHGLKPGETVYFFNTKPCPTEHIFKLNEQQVEAIYDSTKFTISISYNFKGNNRQLNLSQYLFVGDFISLNGRLFKIKQFIADSSSNSLNNRIAKVYEKDTLYNSMIISGTYTNVGFVRQNKKGFTSDNLCALNSKKGHKVVYVYTDNEVSVDPQTSDDIKGNSIRFTINLPWDQIKGNFENSSGNQYISDTVFFIKKSLQVSYMFKFSIIEKQTKELDPELV